MRRSRRLVRPIVGVAPAHLAMTGCTRAQLVGTSRGTVSLHGRQLTLVGDDLDRRMSRFESSQGFNLADVDVATIDPRGRASVRQAMHGSFVHPVLEKPRLLASLAGPVLALYRQAWRILPQKPRERCDSGSVPPPG